MNKDAVLAMYEVLMGEDPTTPTAVRFALQEPEDQALFVRALGAAMPHIRRQLAEEIRAETDKPQGFYPDPSWYHGMEDAANYIEHGDNQ